MGILSNIISEVYQNELPTHLYHGSPFKFDKFSLAHINTGQGSQDFGYGLYFTTDKESAKFYANELSRELSPKDKFEAIVKSYTPDFLFNHYLEGGYKGLIKRQVQEKMANGEGKPEEWSEFLESLDNVRRHGYVYTVNIENPKYISRDDYTTLLHKYNITEKQFVNILLEKGYNGIIYEMNTRHCSDRDFTGEWNVVIIDENVIHFESVEDVYFDGYMKLKI